MISNQDLRDRVAEWGLRDDVVEKDYVLGWVLAGIGSEPALCNGWVFKGGTCLKKCYLETFRFSEDLDFTVLDNGPSSEEEVRGHLGAVLARVASASGIDFSVREPRIRTLPNGSMQGRIYYRGPRNASNPASIRIDLTVDEALARLPVLRPIQHLYPDQLLEPGTVRCYSLEEVYAEKIRAMGERGRPRDLYDVIFLLDHPELTDHPQLVYETLETKCQSKGVPIPTIERLERASTRSELESEWENMLGHQLPALAPLDHYWSRLSELFSWLVGAQPRHVPAPVTGGTDETVWAPSPTAWSWGSGPALEPVRFAGANRLCVDLGYQGSTRRIEPYSLRLTQDNNLLLYARRRDNGELRSYRVDRIESATITTEPFQPRDLVEFHAGSGDPAPSMPVTRRQVATSTRYRVQCPMCGKTFPRKKPGTTLKPHKSREGYPCSGRRGYQI